MGLWHLVVEESRIGWTQTQVGSEQSEQSSDGQKVVEDPLGELLEGLDLDGPTEDLGRQHDGGETAKTVDESDVVALMLEQARSEMLAAGRLLASDRFGEETQRHQQQVVDLIDSLLDALESGQQSTDGAEESSGAEQTTASGTEEGGNEESPSEQRGDSQTKDNESGNAGSETGDDRQSEQGQGGKNSSEDAGDGRANGSPVKRPLGVRGEAIWGHLPERQRGVLRAETPTEYLPKYEDQIRRYFEMLAEIAGEEQR